MNILIVFTGDHQQYQVPRRVRCPNRGGDQVHAEPAANGGAGQLWEGRQESLWMSVNRGAVWQVCRQPLRRLSELQVWAGRGEGDQVGAAWSAEVEITVCCVAGTWQSVRTLRTTGDRLALTRISTPVCRTSAGGTVLVMTASLELKLQCQIKQSADLLHFLM